MIFYLKRLPSGRVYISQIEPKETEEVLKTIDAETWIKGREEVKDSDFYHDYGYGYIKPH